MKKIFAALLIFLIFAALTNFAAVQRWKADLLPNTTNTVIFATPKDNNLTLGFYGIAATYCTATVGITNLPTGTNVQTLTLTAGTNTAWIFTWTNSANAGGTNVAAPSSVAAAVTNLAAAIVAYYPGIITATTTNLLTLTSYGNTFALASAGTWATNTSITTNLPLARVTVNVSGSLDGDETFSLTNYNQILALSTNWSSASVSTNNLGAWQSIILQIITASTNGVCPGFSVDAATK